MYKHPICPICSKFLTIDEVGPTENIQVEYFCDEGHRFSEDYILNYVYVNESGCVGNSDNDDNYLYK